MMHIWSTEDDAYMTRLYREGHTMSEISRSMLTQLSVDVSRCAVSGRLSRLGICATRTEGQKRKRDTSGPRVNPFRAPRQPKPQPIKLAPPPAFEPLPVGPLNDFPAGNGCRWIHGDPRTEWRCCGVSQKIGSSYCSHHDARSESPRTPPPVLAVAA